eukprot:SAG11_NODE_27774_length_329_cov_0.665217_1_plen_60_part_01
MSSSASGKCETKSGDRANELVEHSTVAAFTSTLEQSCRHCASTERYASFSGSGGISAPLT